MTVGLTMTWSRIKSRINEYRILLSICVVLLAVLTWDIATTENKIYIQTAQPEDDFVVVCGWWSGFLSLHGGDKRVNYRVLVGKSNTVLDCGWWFYGNLSVTISHPLYREMRGCDLPMLCVKPGFRHKDGKMVFSPVAFDQYLDSLHDEYKSGFYDDEKEPLKYFGERLKYACGFYSTSRGRYLDLFIKAEPLDYREFKNRYYQKTVECVRKRESIRHDFGLSSYFFYLDDAGYMKPIDKQQKCDKYNLGNCQYRPHFQMAKQVERMWGLETWRQYVEGPDDEIERLLSQKRTFIAFLRIDPKYTGNWFLIDAHSKRAIEKKYPKFKVYEEMPSGYGAGFLESRIKDCEGNDAHWDIDEEPTGWLLDYENGNIYDVICD